MSKTVTDVIDFNFISPDKIFQLLTSPKKIAEITGFKTSGGKETGDNFTAMNGHVSGKTIYVVPDKMIVQSWRRNIWNEDWLDAVVIIAISQKENGTRIDLINANLPETEVQFMDWNTYWNPMKEHLMRLKKQEAVYA
jgi:activator of HSP90 ATPase